MRDLPISFRRRRRRVIVVVVKNSEASQPLISTFSSCPSCGTGKMSSMPMGHFAAFKVRQQMNNGNGNEAAGDDGQYGNSHSSSSSFSATKAMSPSSASSDGCPDNPTKYTSKAMMAIWGAYNRSVHHFKSNAFDKA